MRIAIDIRPLRDTMTGIGRYLSKLLEALSKCDAHNEYRLFYSNIRGNTPRGLPQTTNFKTLTYRYPGKLITALWAYSGVPAAELFVGAIDVFHAPGFQVPPVRRCARVFTVYDLIPIIHPEMSIPSSVRHFRPRVRHYTRRADLIVAISRATAADLTRHLDVPESKIAVIYPGTTALEKASSENIESTKVKYGISGEFILFVSRIDPRKNLPRLMKAFEVSGLHNDFELILVGPEGWYMEQFHSAYESLLCKWRIKWLRYVPDSDLAALYSAAALLVYPSLLEGFGLPILEAMSVGCPVLTSNLSSMPEVTGEAALLIDPFEIDSIADGMKKLAMNSSLRENLSRLGRDRVRLFTWENTARQMIDVYKRASEMTGGRR
jgi:glycosyltransferase involved in cell wall biosynthesis